jgi:hypothetical protein
MGGNIDNQFKRSLTQAYRPGFNAGRSLVRGGQGGFMGQSMGAGNPGGTIQQPMFYQPAPASQIGTGAPVANTGQSFVQGSLNSKKGDANYDAFSDFNNDGMVTTLDFAEYNKANPGGQASMIESDQSIANQNNQRQQMMDARGSLMDQLRQMDEGLGMRMPATGYQQQYGYRGRLGGRRGKANSGMSIGMAGGGLVPRYQNGGLIKGYRDGGEMMDPRVEEMSMMMEEETMESPSGTESEMLKIVMEAKAALEGNHPNPEYAVERFVEAFGEDELMSLQEHVIRSMESGMDEFRSDGMSDSIPGNIDGMEQVALSEGEYIVPADVVSGLGNGDTESGARELRDLIGKVRGLRNGSTQQPPAIDPSMMMPV